MPGTKIVSEQEIVRWYEEGRTYQWMVAEYKKKYDIDVVPSMFGNFRRRRGLQRRITRDDELIPWFVRREHRWAYPLAMLRVEARRRAGRPLRASDDERLRGFLSRLERDRVVVDYDPDSPEGFLLVLRLPSDEDIIRRPTEESTVRRAAD